MFRFCIVLSALLIGACASIQYNLPVVANDTDGLKRPGKFIWHDLISDDPSASARFYGELFGWTFRSLELVGANYWVISLDGTPIAGMVSQADLPTRRDVSQWVSVLSVPDIDQATSQVRSAGGRVLREPVSIGDRGVIAVFADAQGAHFAALNTATGDPADGVGLPAEGAFLWHELWTSDVASAANFYADLGQLQTESRDTQMLDDQPVPYTLLRSAGVPRAGVRAAPDPDMPALWMPYLRVVDENRLDAILEQVTDLAGSVLVPRVARPAGGFVAVIAGPSGAPIALQTWGDDQTPLEDI